MRTNLLSRITFGLIAGAGIAAVDNLAYHGEISPMVIVAMLLLTAAVIGATWGSRSFIVVAIVWAWLPGVHVVKKALHLADTLYPNTYTSIVKLAVFSLVVTTIGFGLGLLLRAKGPERHES